MIGERVKFTGRRSDGTVFPAEIVITEARLDGDRITISIGQDIDERTRSEQALKESERRFRAIFDNAGSASPSASFATGGHASSKSTRLSAA